MEMSVLVFDITQIRVLKLGLWFDLEEAFSLWINLGMAKRPLLQTYSSFAVGF